MFLQCKIFILATVIVFHVQSLRCYGFTTKPLQVSSKCHSVTSVPHVAPIASLSNLTPPTAKHTILRKPLSISLDNHGEKGNAEVVFGKEKGLLGYTKETSTETKNKNTQQGADVVDKNLFQEHVQSIIPAHKKLAVSLMTIMIFLATMIFNPLRANAVPSGGRVGGSFGGGSRSSSSAPSTRMYSSPPSTYSRGFSRGYTSGYYSRPNIVVSPFYTPRPFFSPFWSPGYYGPGAGVTVVSRGPNLFSVFALGGMLLFSAFVWNSMSSSLMSNNFGAGTMTASTNSALGNGVSVVKLSIAMNVPKRDDPNSILSVLDRLSSKAKTDSRVGVSNLVSQVSLELLRRKDSIVAASSSYKNVGDPIKAQREFNNLSVKERSKFEKETISKYGGVDYSPRISADSSASYLKDAPQATMAVVTLLLSIDGDSTQVPNIRSVSDITSALSRIASDVKVGECLRSAEILWTPEERSDTLSTRDIISDYPDLTTI